MGDIPSQTQQESPFATEPFQEDDAPEDDDFYVDEQGNIAHLAPINSYTGQKSLAELCKEGGAPLINILLAKAIQPGFEMDKSLPPAARTDVRDWQFQDILRLPKAQMEEWKKACHEELESLRERRVFELTDLPAGRKVVKNRWVFDIKSDGRKKARLVAKGFSQQEGINFNTCEPQLFGRIRQELDMFVRV